MILSDCYGRKKMKINETLHCKVLCRMVPCVFETVETLAEPGGTRAGRPCHGLIGKSHGRKRLEI
jgi:hypothetical protein